MSTDTQTSTSDLAGSLRISQEYADGFAAYFSAQGELGISSEMNDRTKPMKANEVTYRQINSWDQYGLLDMNRENPTWRKFSLIDCVWLNVISELRMLGYTIDQLRLLKKSLSQNAVELKTIMPVLEYGSFLSLFRVPVVLVVFKDGSGLALPFEDYKKNLVHFGIKPHIYIDMNELIQRLYPEDAIKPEYPLENTLSCGEAQLLAFIQKGDYERVEVRFKNKKIELLEGMERVDTGKKIVDVLNEKQFQSIEVIKKDNTIVSMVRKVKEKVSVAP